MRKVIPVILAGGSGSRLWPLSRTSTPKQFLKLFNDNTLLQETLLRIKAIDINECIIITNENHRFMVRDQAETIISHVEIILEPVSRNTAPAIALAAFHALKNNDDPILLILAADHYIEDQQAFKQAIMNALESAKQDHLVTFGIVPTAPETGYGYIKTGAELANGSFEVANFVEKPDFENAVKYLASKEYLWNSGMFIFKASSYLRELKSLSPKIYNQCQNAIEHVVKDLDFLRIDKDAFEKCPDDSIDYAVMEKTRLSAVVPLDAGWSDIGSWSALWDLSCKDARGNLSIGDVISHNSNNNYIHSSEKLVTLVGIDNAVIIETKDALLVAKKDQVQDVKFIVNELKKSNRKEIDKHARVFSPWGNHELIAEGSQFSVKKVTVKPGKKTTKQIHNNRAEHWVVVSGTAQVEKEGVQFILNENESTYIPAGTSHSFSNPGSVPLIIIEVRTGTYLEEDDITRLDEGQ